MRRFLSVIFTLLVLAATPLLAQDATFPTQPQVIAVLQARTTSGTSLWFDLSSVNPPGNTNYFTLTWFSKGTVPTCSIKSEQSPLNNGTSVSDLNTAETCTSSDTTSGAATLTAGSNYVRINLGTKTGSGTTYGILLGYRQNPYGSVTTNSGSAPLPTNAATASNQTDGSQKTQVYYGGTSTPILPSDIAPVNSSTAPVSTLNSSSMASGLGAAVGCVYDDTSPTSLTENNFGYVRCGPTRELYVAVSASALSPGWDTLNATAADGATACTNSAQTVKASPGKFGGYFINNPNTADSWLHVYNVASGSVTVGTTNPKLTFRIPGVAANSAAANLEITVGVGFDTAIAIACTSSAAGSGAPSVALEADILFK